MIEAARLAVALHLYPSHSVEQTTRQRVTIGGAGPALFKEELLPTATDRPRRSPRFAEGGAE